MRLHFFRLACATYVFCMFLSCNENEIFELSPNAEEANKSYVNQFKAIWAAIDLNYPIWDFERDEYGLNWDDVYDEYLPQFTKLDQEYLQKGDATNTSKEAEKIYRQFFTKLHDGHFYIEIKDVYNGNRYYPLTEYASNFFRYHHEPKCLYENVWNSYKNRGINGHTLLDSKRIGSFLYGYFSGDIVYYHLGSFEYIFFEVYDAWLSRIKMLNDKGVLKGIILDVRNNDGGYPDNYQYFLGSLHGGIDGDNYLSIGYKRTKGVGRYDYPEKWAENLVVSVNAVKVSAPIIVLADSTSKSAAELTCIAAKKLPNVLIAGTPTYGAFSGMRGHYTKKSFTEFGDIGDPHLRYSSFYISMPLYAFLTLDNKIIEGKGVEPDIFVARDWEYTGDNQLERAFEYLDTGH